MKKYSFQLLGIIVALVAQCTMAMGQKENISHFLQPVQKAAGVFSDSSYLHVDMSYYYAAGSKPSAYLDSINAEYKIWKNNSWYRIDSTEALRNERLMVVVFRQDKLLYLSKPDKSFSPQSQFALLDSIADGRYPVSHEISKQGSLTCYSLKFLQPTIYKEMHFWIDRQGRITKTSQVINSLLLQANMKEVDTVSEEWMLVELRFANYRTDDFAIKDFNISRYLEQVNGEWRPVSGFGNFNVFKAQPQL